MKLVPDRRALLVLFRELGLLNEGAEIGVYEGDYSVQILDHWWGKKLWLIDPWRRLDDWLDHLAFTDEEGEVRMARALEKLTRFGERPFEVIRATSLDAVGEFEDGELDWVYIDANHGYEAVKGDLRGWYPKVRVGGVLSGHDYFNAIATHSGNVARVVDADWDRKELGTYGVKAAVDEFVKERGVKLYVTTDDPPSRSWYFMKES